MIMCLGFVFSAMVELALVLVLKQKQGWFTAIENVIDYDASSEDTVFKTRIEADNDIFTRPVNALGDCSIGGLIPSCIGQEIGDKYEHDKYEHAVLGARIQRILGSSAQNSRKIKHI